MFYAKVVLHISLAYVNSTSPISICGTATARCNKFRAKTQTHTHTDSCRTRFSNIFIIWYLSFEFCVNVLVTNIWLDSLSLFPAED